jgi:hypothetical protein
MASMYGRSASTWYRANSPASKLLWAKWGGSWVSAKAAYVKTGGAWVDTSITGLPNAPQLAGTGQPNALTSLIGSAADNFSTVYIAYWGPSSGPAPTGFIHRMYNSSYTLLQQIGPGDAGYAAGGVTFNVSPDTAYVFRVYSVNAAGESLGYLESRYAIGHTQLTHQQANYGWGADYNWATDCTFASSQIASREAYKAVDWKDNTDTCLLPTSHWQSANRGANWQMEGLRLYPRGGLDAVNARLSKIKYWPCFGSNVLIGLWQGLPVGNPGGWKPGTEDYGRDDLASLWIDGTARSYLGHPYCMSNSPASSGTQYTYDCAGHDIRAGHMICDVVTWDLTQYGGVYIGGLYEVLFMFQNWEVQSYSTIVDRNQQNCYFW